MRHQLAVVFGAILLGASAVAWARASQTLASATSIDEVLQAVRADLQSSRRDIIAKNVTFTAEQAAAFWPMFDLYQNQQNAILDDQLKGIQRFIEEFDRLDDAAALGLLNAHLDRDSRMVSLRQRWLPDFQQAIGTKLAVRVMQIDRRISLAQQTQFVAKIPLVH